MPSFPYLGVLGIWDILCSSLSAIQPFPVQCLYTQHIIVIDKFDAAKFIIITKLFHCVVCPFLLGDAKGRRGELL